MHDRDIVGKNAEDIVFLNAFQVLVLMRSVVGDALVPVETEAGPLREYEDDGIVPVDNLPGDENMLQIGTELHEAFRSFPLELRNIAFAWRKPPSGNACQEHGSLVHGGVGGIRE